MKLNTILPFENYVLISNLSVEEVKKRIADNIEPRKTFHFRAFNYNLAKPYEGQIIGDTFVISRIINYRNSFLPIITGHISTIAGQTQINIKMRPVIFVLVFISLWLGAVGAACIGIIFVGLLNFKQTLQNGFSSTILIPFGMFVFGCLLTILAFKAESKKSKKFLESLLQERKQLSAGL